MYLVVACVIEVQRIWANVCEKFILLPESRVRPFDTKNQQESVLHDNISKIITKTINKREIYRNKLN